MKLADTDTRQSEGFIVLAAYREAYEAETGNPCPPLSIREISDITGIPRSTISTIGQKGMSRLSRHAAALDQPNTQPLDPDMELPDIRPGDQIRNITPGSEATITSTTEKTITIQTATGEHTHKREVFEMLLRKVLQDGATHRPA